MNHLYLPFPSQPKLGLLYRPRRDGRLSWPGILKDTLISSFSFCSIIICTTRRLHYRVNLCKRFTQWFCANPANPLPLVSAYCDIFYKVWSRSTYPFLTYNVSRKVNEIRWVRLQLSCRYVWTVNRYFNVVLFYWTAAKNVYLWLKIPDNNLTPEK